MVVEKNIKVEDYIFKKGNLNFAVVGHVEWINFLKVDQLPKPGVISHSEKFLEYPAGGGSIIAKTLSELTLNQIHFFTALGNCLLYTSPSPRDLYRSRMPSSA